MADNEELLSRMRHELDRDRPFDRALAEEAIEALSRDTQSGWRDIATAPNKVHVLVAQPGEPPVRAWKVGEAWLLHGSATTPLEGRHAPTHWQPLPTPPKAKTP